jgi:hypothetical protein
MVLISLSCSSASTLHLRLLMKYVCFLDPCPYPKASSENHRILCKVLLIIEALARTNPVNQAAFVDAGVVESLLTHMTATTLSDYQAKLALPRSLSHLLHLDAAQTRFVTAAGVQVIHAQMDRLRSDQELQRRYSHVLHFMTIEPEDDVQAVVAKARKYPDLVELQAAMCHAMTLTRYDSTGSMAAGAAEVVLAGLRTHVAHVSLVHTACYAVAALALNHAVCVLFHFFLLFLLLRIFRIVQTRLYNCPMVAITRSAASSSKCPHQAYVCITLCSVPSTHFSKTFVFLVTYFLVCFSQLPVLLDHRWGL